ncbi:MAG TPA: tape measure protein [Bacteroidales bacterium]|nr:tape measure protein [Bacteroidales bacterium]
MGSPEGKKMYSVGLDTSEFNRQASEISKRFKDMDTQAVSAGNSIENAFKKTSAVVGGLLTAAAAKQFVSQVVKVRGEFQQLGIAFETMLGSKAKADKLMKEAISFAAKTPFTLTDVASNIKQLMAMNATGDDVISTIKALGDVAAGVSVPISRLAINYGQVANLGKLQSREVRDFAMAGVPLIEELAKNFGKTTQEIQEMIEAGKIGFKDVERAFQTMSSEGGKFYNLMEKQNKSVTGQISNLKDKIDVMLNSIGQANEGIIYSGISGTAKIVENYEQIGRILAGMVITYGAYKTAVIAVNLVLKQQAAVNAMIAASNGVFNAGLARQWLWTERVQKAQALLNKTMLTNPYVLIATAVVAVGAAIWVFSNRTTAAEKAQKKLNDELEKAAQNKEELKNKSAELSNIIDSETATVYQQIKAYEELQSKFPEIYKNMSLAQFKNLPVPERQKMEGNVLDQRELNEAEASYKSAQQRIVSLNREMDNLARSAQSGAGFMHLAKQIKDAEAYAKVLEVRLNKINADRKVAEFEAKPKEDKILFYNRELDVLKKQRDEIEDTLLGIEKTNDRWAKFSLQTIVNTGKLEEVNKKLDEAANKLALLNGTEKPVIQNKSYWEEEKKKAEESLEAMAASEKGTKAWNEAIEKLNQAKKKLTLWDFKEETKNEQNRLAILKELREKELSLQLEKDGAMVDLMKEGYAKQNALAKQQYNERLAALDKQEKDYLDKLNESKGYKEGDKQYITSLDDYVKTNASDTTSANFIKTLNELKLAANLEYFQKLGELDRERFDTEKQAMNDYLKEFGTYQEKRLAIVSEYSAKIAKTQTKGEKSTLEAERDKELQDLDAAMVEQSDLWIRLFEDAGFQTTRYINETIRQTEGLLNYLQGVEGAEIPIGFTEEQLKSLKEDPEKIKEILEGLKRKRDELNTRNPFANLITAFKELREAAKGSNEEFEALSKVISSFSAIGDILGQVGSALEQVGSKAGKTLSDVSEVVNTTASMAGQGMAVGGPVGAAIGAVIGLTTSLVKVLSGNKTEKIERDIARLQGQADTLKKTYDQLGKAIEKAYSTDANELIEEQNKNLNNQKAIIEQQIAAEQKKKKPDQERIAQWQVSIDEINNTIEENKENAVDAIFGADVQSAIDDFAQAYVDAWSAGEDKAKAMKDVVKNMIKGVIVEMLKADLAPTIETIRSKIQSYIVDGIIDSAEQADIDRLIEEATRNADNKYSWADQYLGNNAKSSREAIEKGFAAMSQDTADELNGRFTAIQGHTFEINQSVKLLAEGQRNIAAMLQSTSSQILNHLSGIRDNTEHCKRLDAIDVNIGSMRQDISTIMTRGIQLYK